MIVHFHHPKFHTTAPPAVAADAAAYAVECGADPACQPAVT